MRHPAGRVRRPPATPPPAAPPNPTPTFAPRPPSPPSRLALQRPLHRHRTRHGVILVFAPPDPSVAFLPYHHCGNVNIEALQDSAVRLPLRPPRRLPHRLLHQRVIHGFTAALPRHRTLHLG